MHLGAITCLLAAKLSNFIQVLGICSIMVSFIYCHFRLHQWTELNLSRDQSWHIANAHQRLMLKLARSNILTSKIIILNFQRHDFPYFLSLVIFPDTLSPVDFRRLQFNLLRYRPEDT
jgi:hypothetical protein